MQGKYNLALEYEYLCNSGPKHLKCDWIGYLRSFGIIFVTKIFLNTKCHTLSVLYSKSDEI
jgi:hypothetical protein